MASKSGLALATSFNAPAASEADKVVVSPNSNAAVRRNFKSSPTAPVIADRFDIDWLKSLAATAASVKNFAIAADANAAPTALAADDILNNELLALSALEPTSLTARLALFASDMALLPSSFMRIILSSAMLFSLSCLLFVKHL